MRYFWEEGICLFYDTRSNQEKLIIVYLKFMTFNEYKNCTLFNVLWKNKKQIESFMKYQNIDKNNISNITIHEFIDSYRIDTLDIIRKVNRGNTKDEYKIYNHNKSCIEIKLLDHNTMYMEDFLIFHKDKNINYLVIS